MQQSCIVHTIALSSDDVTSVSHMQSCMCDVGFTGSTDLDKALKENGFCISVFYDCVIKLKFRQNGFVADCFTTAAVQQPTACATIRSLLWIVLVEFELKDAFCRLIVVVDQFADWLHASRCQPNCLCMFCTVSISLLLVLLSFLQASSL